MQFFEGPPVADLRATDVANLILSEMKTWETKSRTEARCQEELTRMATRIIAFFEPDKKGKLTPSVSNVMSIILEEMTGWKPGAAGVDALAERLTRYFTVFHAQPIQHDGLPGGHPLTPATDFALGRRSISKRDLMSSTTGIVLPS